MICQYHLYHQMIRHSSATSCIRVKIRILTYCYEMFTHWLTVKVTTQQTREKTHPSLQLNNCVALAQYLKRKRF